MTGPKVYYLFKGQVDDKLVAGVVAVVACVVVAVVDLEVGALFGCKKETGNLKLNTYSGDPKHSKS